LRDDADEVRNFAYTMTKNLSLDLLRHRALAVLNCCHDKKRARLATTARRALTSFFEIKKQNYVYYLFLRDDADA
jgi:hypothetical protein